MAQPPRTTIICAVWHKDPHRDALLRGHAENLARQIAPAEIVYVFDGGDAPPSWLKGRVISVREDLTIYQAWNVALALVATPFVMNLNLDDRLAPDAIGHLEREMEKPGVVLAGGDWKICHSQEETDRVEPCYPAELLPVAPHWPPEKGAPARLGSGLAERPIFGPATMWRMAAHLGLPRYPWRFADGLLIRSAGDGAWWSLLKGNPRFVLARLPVIIGNYHSHPESQAEFREPDDLARFTAPGVSLM